MDEQYMGGNQFGEVADCQYHVEVAIVMDATGSMSPIIDEVKKNAMDFCKKFTEKMEAVGKQVAALRVKVVPFRDFAYDGDKSLEQSKFFNLPEENEAFRNYVEQIQAFGGGDEPENALEAIAVAMRSDWTTEKIPGIKRRHVILVFTDASAAPLKDASKPDKSKCSRIENSTYPENMPSSLAELSDMWEGISQDLGGMPEKRSKRIVLFVPNSQPWNEIVWNQSWQNFSKAGKGLDDVSIEQTLEMLVGSMGD